MKQQTRDRIKAELCLKNDIILIVVPHTLNYDEFQDYILEEYNILTGKEIKNEEKYNWRTFKKEKITLPHFF